MKTNEVTIPFDLDENNVLCDGTLTLTGQGITRRLGGQETFFPLADISEAVAYSDVGCGRLELRPNGGADDGSDNVPVCRCSMSCITQVGELVKVLNHYLLSGELLDIDEESLPVCPKCHRHYPKGMNVCLFCVKKRSVFSRAFTFFKPHLGKVVVSGILLTLANLLSSVLPLLNSQLIDNYLVPVKNAKPYFDDPVKGVIAVAGLMALLFLVSRILNIFSTRLSNRIGSQFSGELRKLVYEKIQALSLTSMSGRSTGNLLHRITRDTERVKDFFNQQGRYLIEQTVMFIVVLTVLFCTNWLLALLVVVPLPIAVFMISRFWASTHLRYHKQWRVDSRATAILHDIIKGIRVVKSFGNEEREIEKFSKVSKDLADICAYNEKYWAVTFPMVGSFMTLGEFLVLIVGGAMVLRGDLTLGEMTRFNLYLAFLYAPLRWMSTFPRRVADASTALVKIYEILDEKQTLDDSGTTVFDPSGAITFKDVDFGYRSYEPVLKNVNFTIAPGEMVGLVGHSGAGKSTIINLCLRLYDVGMGSITVGGTDIRTVSQHDLRDGIGVVFQETYLFSGTAYDNIAYARPNATPEEVIAAARAARAHDFITALPDGYNTVIGENGHTLSGGERQRISIARAILKNPKILILDEATSSLDPETEIQIQEALAELTKGRTTIAIAHRLATLHGADRLIVLEKGRIVQIGPHSELVNEDGIYRNLVLAQRETTKLVNE